MDYDEEPLQGEELWEALRQIRIELEARAELLREGEKLLNSPSPADRARLAEIELHLGFAITDTPDPDFLKKKSLSASQ